MRTPLSPAASVGRYQDQPEEVSEEEEKNKPSSLGVFLAISAATSLQTLKVPTRLIFNTSSKMSNGWGLPPVKVCKRRADCLILLQQAFHDKCTFDADPTPAQFTAP